MTGCNKQVTRKNMRIHGSVVICILGLLCTPVKAVSYGGMKVQSSSAGMPGRADNQVSGKIIAANGKVAPGAIVTLRDIVTGDTMTDTADSHGKYFFANVVQGEYSLSARFNGKESEVQNISLNHKEKFHKDLKIKND